MFTVQARKGFDELIEAKQQELVHFLDMRLVSRLRLEIGRMLLRLVLFQALETDTNQFLPLFRKSMLPNGTQQSSLLEQISDPLADYFALAFEG